MKAILREPLLHFILLGAGIFALFTVFDSAPPPVSSDLLEITEADAERLVQQHQATWRRPPTEQELAGLIDNLVSEEVLVREALTLGLDRGDAIIRQRLALKMEFLMESGAEFVEAPDDVLAAHLAAHPERFTRAGLVSFEQFMLSPEASPEATVAAVRTGKWADSLIAPSLLPSRLPPSPPSVVDGTFGPGFHKTVSALTSGDWSGPVESTYGPHIIRVLSKSPARLPPLSEIRDNVERDWRATIRVELADQRLEAMKNRYEIIRPDPTQVLAQ